MSILYIPANLGNLTYHSHGMNIPNSPELLRFQHEYIPKKEKGVASSKPPPLNLLFFIDYAIP